MIHQSTTLPESTKLQAGFSLLEILIAMFLLIIVVTGLARIVTTGDVIFSKGKAFAIAAILAGNESERIRAIGAAGMNIKDTVYEETMENSEYVITRKVLASDQFPDNGLNTREIALTITKKSTGKLIKEFRIAQGISR
jgi:Tfp pilus assembly protein PilV